MIWLVSNGGSPKDQGPTQASLGVFDWQHFLMIRLSVNCQGQQSRSMFSTMFSDEKHRTEIVATIGGKSSISDQLVENPH